MDTIIEPVKQNVAHPQHKKTYSSSLRLWHWANALVITGSLLTVLVNSTILKSRNSVPLIKAELQKDATPITDAQAKAMNHVLSDKVWDIHVYFGYALAALFLFRIVLEFFQLADQKFIRTLKIAYAHFKNTKNRREGALHEFTVKTIYTAFYLLLLIMVLTGLFLAFEDFFAPYKAIRHTVKNVHGFCMYLVLAFIAVHLLGVFLAERKESPGIVSDMINGGGD